MSELTYAKIKKIIAQEIGLPAFMVTEGMVTMDTPFETLILNFCPDLPMDAFIMAFEDQFDLDSISDEDAAKIITVRDAIEYIDCRLGMK
ncbi:MAG: Acyl carrier protein [bacterium ADurb.Bin429]|nr:MAG: Acyl carrier protein [bacterium ADurb.Bin429]